MKKVFLSAGYWLVMQVAFAQTVSQKLQKAFQQFEKDSQLKYAISSLYVIDAATGKTVFEKNAQVGLAPASTQKIITSVTAFELLGKEYRYKTELGYNVDEGAQKFICLRGFGDPTFGSIRYTDTKATAIFNEFTKALKKTEQENINPNFIIDNTLFETKSIPDGWIMQDVGNYYGAGASAVNWKENQFDLTLKSTDKVGDKVQIVAMNEDKKVASLFVNELKAAAKGTGDNAYIYLPSAQSEYVVRGTIPVGESAFKISGAATDGASYFVREFGSVIKSMAAFELNAGMSSYVIGKLPATTKILYTHYSPSLDSIIYWFNKKSINLYGEALVKTFAYEKTGFGSTDTGVSIVKKFWREKGLDEHELNIVDGSGLSPLNRVTTHAQVEILKYAKTKDWFTYFYNSLPDYNGMKMKSGTISNVKGFCGYHKAQDGKEYIFSFLVNNYNGSSSALVSKMYKVLNELK
jgi:serine-type D-Ala-D-Ala carboxypeptidase/endopeptidase (penicillin-binding protein 4)